MDTATVAPRVEIVPIGQVKAAADNDREQLGDVVELSTSMVEVGVINPLVVRELANGSYEVIAGARRLAAAEIAGLDEVPIIIRDVDEDERLLIMAAENLQREDLSPLEEGRAYRRLIDTLGCSQRDLAPKVGKAQSHISKRIALLELPKDVQAKVDSGGITIADAVELAKIADHPTRVKKVMNGPTYQSIALRVQHELDDLKREQKIAKQQEEFESKGYATIVVQNQWQLPAGVHRLKGGSTYDAHALDITAKKHETGDCHAIAIPRNGDGAFPVCTNRKNHPKVKTAQENDRANGGSSRPRPKPNPATQKLQLAREARMQLAGALVAKKPSKDALQFVMLHFVERTVDYFDGDGELDRVAIWLGVTPAPEDGSTLLPDEVDAAALILEFAGRGDAECQRAALALTFADVDDHSLESMLRTGEAPRRVMRRHSDDRSTSPVPRAYLEFLRTQGHELHELERKALDGTAAVLPAAA